MTDLRSRISMDPILARLYQVWHTVLFVEKDASAESYEPWPLPGTMNDSDASLFRAFIILSGTMTMESSLTTRCLSEWLQFCRNEFIHATRMHFELHGVYGLENSSMWWLWPVFLGRVFRIGRLTCEIAFYTASWKVYRHREGRLLLLAGDSEQRYDENGLESGNGPYQPAFRETESQVTGNGFSHKGTYLPEPITLDSSAWTEIASAGDPIISLHIPAGGRLDPDAVKESLNRARQFFVRHFPDLTIRLFTCHSWLLDSGLSELLPPPSNILAFQRLFTIALANPDNEALHTHIFGAPPGPLEQLIPKTEFQKRLLAHVRQGGILRDGFGVLSFQDCAAEPPGGSLKRD